MHQLILWSGFLGAWLLVAGPVYQAVLELQAEEIEMDRIRKLATELPPPPPVSNWWWLLPPVLFFLERRRNDIHQRAIVDHLSDEDFVALTRFVNKAMGWVLVGGGGFLIAVKETHELTEGLDWPIAVFWVLLVVMLALAIGNVAARSLHDQRVAAGRGISSHSA